MPNIENEKKIDFEIATRCDHIHKLGTFFGGKFCENFGWFTDLRTTISHIAVSRRPVFDLR